jgi:hypothetical protein
MTNTNCQAHLAAHRHFLRHARQPYQTSATTHQSIESYYFNLLCQTIYQYALLKAIHIAN